MTLDVSNLGQTEWPDLDVKKLLIFSSLATGKSLAYGVNGPPFVPLHAAHRGPLSQTQTHVPLRPPAYLSV